ncbi:hypothetical protein V1508DRAFT_408381 [Lipomyces doorenjongii]|uniref:uncharacterized protein n=1 Tax=Lipomyces doorenjongii TaxID=383834 RepID=UPI0034CF7304
MTLSLHGDSYGLPICFVVTYFLVVMIIVPESPRGLAAHDMEDEARRVIGNITNKDLGDPDVIAQYNDIS